MGSVNRYGFDVGNEYDDHRFVEKDYSIGGGVTMYQEFDHGFHHEEGLQQPPVNKYDRIRGTMGTNRGEHYGKGPKGWSKPDVKIVEEVCEVLTADPYLDASDIEVNVKEAVVYLHGWVDSREDKHRAERIIEEIVGVHDIHNELTMRNRRMNGGVST